MIRVWASALTLRRIVLLARAPDLPQAVRATRSATVPAIATNARLTLPEKGLGDNERDLRRRGHCGSGREGDDEGDVIAARCESNRIETYCDVVGVPSDQGGAATEGARFLVARIGNLEASREAAQSDSEVGQVSGPALEPNLLEAIAAGLDRDGRRVLRELGPQGWPHGHGHRRRSGELLAAAAAAIALVVNIGRSERDREVAGHGVGHNELDRGEVPRGAHQRA